jgi:dTMP kinase
MHPSGGRGFFLTLEGPEGSGKSTQARLLAARLSAAGFRCLVTREPGGTALSEAVRQILLHSRDLAPVPAADALLFNAARAQLAAEVIEPALERGEVVICDRFADSTLAYQGYGAGQSLEDLRSLARYAVGDLRPDLTVLIDLPVEDGLRRKQGDEVTRFEEREDVDFHRRVREGFLAMAAAEPARFLVVDGSRPVEAVAAAVFQAVEPRLAHRHPATAGTDNRVGQGASVYSSEPERGSTRMDK